MKRKMVFGVVVLALFVLQVQTVFAQNISFQLDIRNGGGVRGRIHGNSESQDLTDRVQYIEVRLGDSGMVIGIQFKDGSMQTYAFSDIGEVENVYGDTSWNNIRMLNPNTNGFFPEYFWGSSKINVASGTFKFNIQNNQGITILLAGGYMRNIRSY